MLLKDTQRYQEILTDNHGTKYYQAYQYSVIGNAAYPEDCKYGCDVEEGEEAIDWFDKPAPALSEDEIKWLEDWEQSSQLPKLEYAR